ncbi:MAG: DUF3179 domain-containing protein [Actinobacteria bacterium]|nr:DUF3179 domain-containing protein [Actinomycetota bacterium]
MRKNQTVPIACPRPFGPHLVVRIAAGVIGLLLFLAACGGGAEAPSSQPGTADPSALVDPSEIISGGPPPDGIPPIDEPKFIRPSEATWLAPQEPVIAIDLNGDARAYPAQIMTWHEIVNDTVGGVPVTVTYCPLCNTGIAFERPTIDGEVLDFGTSGKLYHSNLVMYDRQTQSLWPQVLGQAVVGPLTGTRLEFVPVQMVAWADWRAANPGGKVLSRDTGALRDYGTNPYVGYDSGDPFLFKGEVDPRLPPTARVVGVRVGPDVTAFPYSALHDRRAGDWSVAQAALGGRQVVVFWKQGALSAVDRAVIAESREVGATGVFDARVSGRVPTFGATAQGIVDDQTRTRWDLFGRAFDGPLAGQELQRVISIESFWFDWAAFHPATRIWAG